MGDSDLRGAGRATGAFVGRMVELARLRAMLEEVRSGEPRFVMVDGPAGIGKTALIQRLVDEATGLRVLRGSGEQEERLVPYGVVQQVARSARIALPDRLAGLGSESDRQPEPFAVGTDLLGLVDRLQADGPVAMVVDDVQWADRPSLLAILFALRRLQADRVLAVLVVREGAVAHLPEGLLKLCGDARGATVHLAGLEIPDLQSLATTIRGEPLPVELAEQLRDHTGGSPLHFRALLEELPADRLRSADDAPLPCPRPFAMQVVSRLGSCSPEAQRLVIAASILGIEVPLSLARRLAYLADPLQALEEAISVGLLEARHVDGEQGLAFPHALVRAAIYHDIGPARRATLHLGASQLVKEEAVSLHHRSAAAVGEDDALADDLAEYAQRELARGAWSRAAAALLRASALSSPPERCERRLLDAVDCLLVAGEITRAAAQADEVRSCRQVPYRDYVLGRLAYHQGRLGEAYPLLVSAWDRCEPVGESALANKIAAAVAIVLVRRARGPELVMWARRAMQASGTALPRSLLGSGLAYSGRAEEGLAELDSLPESPGELTADDIDAFLSRGILRFITDDLVGARVDLSVVLRGLEQWGPFFGRCAAASYLADIEYRIGDWDAAVTHGEGAVSLAEASDQNWILSLMHAAASSPLSARGQWEVAESHVQAAAAYARTVNDETSLADAAIAQARLAAARADHAGVVAALNAIAGMPHREGIDEPGSRWPWQELYADALVSLDRLDDAEAVLAPFEERAAEKGRRSAMANAARVRGGLEAARRRFDRAEAAYRAGFGHSDAVHSPFDRARLEEAYGRFQRRLGRRASAISHLKSARAHFVQLDARPYIERCEHVLTLCGVIADRREKQRASLTPPEIAVARLVSQGLSNREVAARLVVSVNTVEYHLKNIYAKLAIFSRRQLADAMRLEDVPGTGPMVSA